MKALYTPFTKELPKRMSKKIVESAMKGYDRFEVIIEGEVCYIMWNDIQETDSDLVVIGLRIEIGE